MKYLVSFLKSLTFVYLIVTIINSFSGRTRKILKRFRSNFIGMMIISGKAAVEGLKTQSIERIENKPIRFVQGDDGQVYWIEDDIVYYAEIVNGQIDTTQGNILDTSMLSSEEVVKIIEILHALREK